MSPVSLISISPQAEELITYCARVSNPANQGCVPDGTTQQDTPESSERLIKYLIKHKHWSPFQLAHMVVEINTTRSIAAQILRHSSFSFQEFSQRYSDVARMCFANDPPALRRQDLTNKQNSIDDLDDDLVAHYQTRCQLLYDQSRKLYQEMLRDGVAKECAREVLPLGTPTRLYMAGSIRSWIHYIDLRTNVDTQKEHRDVALGCKDVFSKALPSVSKALWGEQ